MRAFHPELVEAILFDIDGTLLDTDDAYVERLAHLLRPLQVLLPTSDPKDTARRWVMRAETPTNALLGILDRLALDQVFGPMVDALHRLRGEATPRHFRLIPGTHTALQTLASHYPLAVVTARERSSTAAFLRSFNLEPFVRCVATARTCRRAKPHPAPVRWAAEKIGVPPQACLMVGDTRVDILAGRAAGAQTAGVLCGFGERCELERAGATLILDTIADLPRNLKG